MTVGRAESVGRATAVDVAVWARVWKVGALFREGKITNTTSAAIPTRPATMPTKGRGLRLPAGALVDALAACGTALTAAWAKGGVCEIGWSGSGETDVWSFGM